MIEAIEEIRTNLAQGNFPNEASISQGIVVRLLNELGWPTFNPSIVWPEYFQQGLRVDFALCNPPRKPFVLIEVKQPGHALNAELQLFQYAFHQGAPLIILTTGQEWQFFLPAEPGSYHDRRVYLLDLLERKPHESADRLRRYLDYSAVTSGEALEAARRDYRSISTRRQVVETLPVAWRKLIEDEDARLIAILSEKVESLCGYQADQETILDFLQRALETSPSDLSPVVASRSRRPTPRPDTASFPQPASGEPHWQRQPTDVARSSDDPLVVEPSGPGASGDAPSVSGVGVEAVRPSLRPSMLIVQGQRIPVRTGNDVLVALFSLLTREAPGFPERFVRAKPGTRKRPRLAATRAGVHPGNEGLASMANQARQIPGSTWWLDLNTSWPYKERLIADACEIAGLTYGGDVVVEFT